MSLDHKPSTKRVKRFHSALMTLVEEEVDVVTLPKLRYWSSIGNTLYFYDDSRNSRCKGASQPQQYQPDIESWSPTSACKSWSCYTQYCTANNDPIDSSQYPDHPATHSAVWIRVGKISLSAIAFWCNTYRPEQQRWWRRMQFNA